MTIDPMTTFEKRREALTAETPAWEPLTFGEHFDRCAERWPTRPFLVFGEVATSYESFADRSRVLAAQLSSLGIRYGSRVGLIMGNSPDFYAAKVALARLGAPAVPVNYFQEMEEMAFVLRKSQLSLIIVEPLILGRDMVEALNVTFSHLEDVHPELTLPRVVLMASPEGPVDTQPEFVPDELSSASLPDHRDYPSPDSVCEIIYTSGSSGTPKGVLTRQDAMLREAFGTAYSRALTDGWCSMTALPPFHMLGFEQGVMPVTMVGGRVVVQRRFDPAAQLDAIQEFGVNDVVGVPAMTERLVELAEAGTHDLTSLTAIFSAGNAVSPSAWIRLKKVLGVTEVTTAYGMTEACACPFFVRPDHSFDVLCNSIGFPKNSGPAGIPDRGGEQFEWRLMNPETGEPVSPGAEGEIVLKGPTVTRGYWDDEQETGDAFRDGWFRSGDLGRLRPDGSLVLTGRVKEIYKSGGENVAPREVEIVLTTHSAIREAYVVGVPDARWGETGCAWVVVEPGHHVTADDVIAHCKANLSRFKTPGHVILTESSRIPLTPSGKLDRRQLGAMAIAELDLGHVS